jgi:NAD(P)-dependent dehydrogenase (short-subunit alcohol dehydrogenase family)
VDGLVNTAWIGHVGIVEGMALEDSHEVRRINLNGVMRGTQAAVSHLMESEANIVNIASILRPRRCAGSGARSGLCGLSFPGSPCNWEGSW